ncbi:MAG: hypothetical protein NZM10_05415 [Fimbriimonadales bacterium]|nr:hypothetical protein [Fimbriimonadales bacterium]
MSARRLLLIACSARKRVDAGLLPAMERYDGIFYRVVRRWQQHASPELRRRTDILILSAEFGLLEASTPIPYYDRKMDSARARFLQPRVVDALRKRMVGGGYGEIFLAVGRLYRNALEPLESWVPPEATLLSVSGGIGKQAQQLRDWLQATISED